jgi:hypothetical protein
MKSLTDQSDDLLNKIERITNRESDAEIARSLAVVAEAVSARLQESLVLKNHLSTMKAAGLKEVGASPTKERITSFIKKIESVRKRHKENRANLRQGNTWANCDNDATSLNKELKSELAASWRKYIKENLTDTSNLSTFRQMPNCVAVFRQVDAVNREVEGFGTTLPTSVAQIEALAVKARSARQAVSALKLEGIPQDIQLFLKKASTEGVPMAELTDEIIRWLRDNRKFMVALKINASST